MNETFAAGWAAISRREFVRLTSLGLAWPLLVAAAPEAHLFRIRTLTAGLKLASATDLEPARDAVRFLRQTRQAFVSAGYEVQTLRLATQPLAHYLPNWSTASALDTLRELDAFAVDSGVVLSLGPVVTRDEHPPALAEWAADLIRHTRNTSFSCAVASAQHGLYPQAVRVAAAVMHTIARSTPGGAGNFNFAATALVPPGTPFFPAAWFESGRSFSIGLESPNLLTAAFEGAADTQQAAGRLRAHLEQACVPIATLAGDLARASGWRYLGIDTSPAPGLDASIGQAIEALTGAPFGSPSTLAGCAAITDVLRSLDIQSCGYSGLMLPVLEDRVLAQRAAEGRFGVAELLLYSSVCGTGLDVVPLPGDTPVEALAAVIGDVAALAVRYHKPLSARLFPAPGKQVGDTVRFDNLHLTDAPVMALG